MTIWQFTMAWLEEDGWHHYCFRKPEGRLTGMSRFQIRFPKELGIELWIEKMIEQAWLFRPADRSQRNLVYEEFRQSMISLLSRYIGTFPKCGELPECTEEVEGGPWLDYDDQIYHILAPQGFESLIEDLSEETRKYLHVSAHEILPHIRGMFRKSLSEYIYFNPVCGSADICGEASHFYPIRSVLEQAAMHQE